jgi:alkylation response protein AidB-like acyl-CoA dehydrogenase
MSPARSAARPQAGPPTPAASAEHRELRKIAADFLNAKCPPEFVRACYDDPGRWRGLWDSMVDLGWAGLADRRIAGPVELCVVLEECGAALVTAPMLSSVGHALGALSAVDGDGAAEIATELGDGAVGTLLASSPGRPMPGAALHFDDGRVRGTAVQVAAAERADLFVGLAVAGDGAELLVVLRAGAGVSVAPTPSADPSRPLADVVVDVRPELSAVICHEAALAVPLLASSAELVGVARRALELSVGHACTREQFGVPIGSFQAMKHRLADVHLALERARSLVSLAASRWAGDGDDDAGLDEPGRWALVLLAKAAAADAADAAARAGVAVHGALGQTWEHDMHLLLRRAWLGALLLGDSQTLYAEAARLWLATAPEPTGWLT